MSAFSNRAEARTYCWGNASAEPRTAEPRMYDSPTKIVLSGEAYDAFVADDEPLTPAQIAAFIK